MRRRRLRIPAGGACGGGGNGTRSVPTSVADRVDDVADGAAGGRGVPWVIDQRLVRCSGDRAVEAALRQGGQVVLVLRPAGLGAGARGDDAEGAAPEALELRGAGELGGHLVDVARELLRLSPRFAVLSVHEQ